MAVWAFGVSCKLLHFIQGKSLSGRPSGLARFSVPQQALYIAENGFTVACLKRMFKALQANLQSAALRTYPLSKEESNTTHAVPCLHPWESSSRAFLSSPVALCTHYQQGFASSPKLLLSQTPNCISYLHSCLPAVLCCCHSWCFFSASSFRSFAQRIICFMPLLILHDSLLQNRRKSCLGAAG